MQIRETEEVSGSNTRSLWDTSKRDQKNDKKSEENRCEMMQRVHLAVPAWQVPCLQQTSLYFIFQI